MLITLEQLLFGLFIGIFVAVWNEILIDDGGVFVLYRKKFLEKIPMWLSKPLGECPYCFGGQIAAWTFLLWEYNPIQHIQYTTTTIFLVLITQETFIWFRNLNN